MLILIYNAINKWRGKTILIRKPYKTNKNISRLFYILMMIIFVWFIGIQILGPDEQFLTNLDIPSSTMVLLHGRNPMAQNKTFLFLDVIKFQQNRRWSLLLHFQMIITRMWSRSVLPFKMYVFTLMENFEKSTMQKSAPIWQKLCQPLYILQYFVCRCRKGTLSGTYNIYE